MIFRAISQRLAKSNVTTLPRIRAPTLPFPRLFTHRTRSSRKPSKRRDTAGGGARPRNRRRRGATSRRRSSRSPVFLVQAAQCVVTRRQGSSRFSFTLSSRDTFVCPCFFSVSRIRKHIFTREYYYIIYISY